jgi:hypothetical protein
MLTPSKYWRVLCSLNDETPYPPTDFTLPESLASQSSPPTRGHGITIAAYDEDSQTGFLRWVGVVTAGTGSTRSVEWKPTTARIDVDTTKGQSYWASGAFGFAKTKIADYGLHELWNETFEGMELRDHTKVETRPTAHRKSRSSIAPERLNPLEVIGEPTSGPKCGVVYVLKSAYGYKVGRTRNVPARMRAFGVHLPFIYSFVLCSWFDDCQMAEATYHKLFAAKRINGEWFNLVDEDIEKIRARLLI